jgi:HSP20 family protein
MAKISRKPSQAPIRIENLNQFLFEVLGDEAGLLSPEPITHVPMLDLFTTPTDLVMEIELPGVRKEDIDITLYKNTLTIRATKLECFEEDKINYVCMERSFGKLFRAVELPSPVDTAKIKANYASGVLTIVMPRVQDKRNSKQKVSIESAE